MITKGPPLLVFNIGWHNYIFSSLLSYLEFGIQDNMETKNLTRLSNEYNASKHGSLS